jgi:putative IMPACT (imprinted ancient) family translation regulator
VLVAVVRYFGGTKLGVGGLIQAYRSAASDALDQSNIVTCKVYDRLKLEFTYEQMNSVMKVIKERQLDFEDQRFDMDCALTIRCWSRNTRQVLDTFSKIKGCKIRLIEN